MNASPSSSSSLRMLRGMFVDREHGLRPLQISFDARSGLILEVQPWAADFPAAPRQEDLGGKGYGWTFGKDDFIFAGLGDLHVHAREDVSQKLNEVEDFVSAGQAALAGGLTFFADMPNNPLPPVDDASYLAKLALTAKAGLPVFLYAAFNDHTRPLSFAVPYKAFLTAPDLSLALTKKDNLAHYRQAWVSFHGEDAALLTANAQQVSHQQRRPVEAEVQAVKNILAWAKEFSLTARICHVTSQAALAEILAAQAADPFYQDHIWSEVTLNHLCFSAANTDLSNPWFNVNPPLRQEEDRQALWHAWCAGKIQVLATDHAPHPLAAKERGASGLPCLDCWAGILSDFYHQALAEGMKKEDFLSLLALTAVENPAKWINHFLATWQKPACAALNPFYTKLGNGLGKLAAGYSASFTVLNFSKSWQLQEKDLRSKMRWSPWLGHTFTGGLRGLFVQGQEILCRKEN